MSLVRTRKARSGINQLTRSRNLGGRKVPLSSLSWYDGSIELRHNFLRSLNPIALIGMGEEGGTETDLSGNGNDGTVTYADGQRGQDPLVPGGSSSLKFQQEAVNVISNPSVETDLAGLVRRNTNANAFARTTDRAMFGDYSVVQELGAGDIGAVPGGYFSVTSVTTAETEWTASAYLSVDFVAAGDFRPMVALWDDVSGFSFGNPIDALAFGEDARSHVTKTWGAGSTDRRFYIFRTGDSGGNGNPGEHIYADGFMMTEGDTLWDYFDGDSGVGYSWDSTEHASASERVATSVNLGSPEDIDNIFSSEGGGSILFLLNRELRNITYVVSKGSNFAMTFGSSESGQMDLRRGFSVTSARWVMNQGLLGEVGTTYAVCAIYDDTSDENTPTFYIGNLDTKETHVLTVGDGLAAITTPSGEVNSDASSNFTVGQLPGSPQYQLNAFISSLTLWSGKQMTEDEFKSWFYSTNALVVKGSDFGSRNKKLIQNKVFNLKKYRKASMLIDSRMPYALVA